MPFTDTLLDHHRTVGDPLADAVMASLDTGDAKATNAVWDLLRDNDDPVPEGLPEPVARFLASTAALPPWAHEPSIRAGEQVFALHGPAIVTGLFCSALPHAYSCAKGAEVLGRTGRMKQDLRRRIDDTAQMVFDVCGPGGLGTKGRGVRTLQKVRLIHAAIRRGLTSHPGWDTARLGVPINAEDIAGTMLTFSWATGRVVEQLGADLDLAEWEAWLHLWRVAASLLGLPDALMPADKVQSEALWRAIKRRQQAPSLAGRQLTAALVEHINSYVPGRMWDGITAELMRLFLDPPVADWLGVPRHNWTGLLLHAERRWYGRADDERDRSALLRRITQWFNLELLEALFLADRMGKKTRFRLPEDLGHCRRSWRVARAWRAVRSERPRGGRRRSATSRSAAAR